MSQQHNPKDPLLAVGSLQQRALFDRFSREADGFSAEDAIGAALNVLINALRQAHARREAAGRSYDEHVARAKGMLMDHYDSTGRKKGIFPYPQRIEVPRGLLGHLVR